MDDKIQNFIELLFEAVEENIEEVTEMLKEHGLDPERTASVIEGMLKQKKAELKAARGEKFKEFYQDNVTDPDQEAGAEQLSLKLAARKQTDDFTRKELNDIKADDKKIKLIKDYMKKNS